MIGNRLRWRSESPALEVRSSLTGSNRASTPSWTRGGTMVAVEAPHGVDADWRSASNARPVGLLGTSFGKASSASRARASSKQACFGLDILKHLVAGGAFREENLC